jgi:hypothetical protein
LKTKTSNDETSEKAMLQSKKAWAQLKAIDGHAIWNVITMQQSVIDRTSISLIIFRPYTLIICEFVDDLPSISSSTLFNFAYTSSGKAQTKVKML